MGRAEPVLIVEGAFGRGSYLIPLDRQDPALRGPIAEVACMLLSPDVQRSQIDARIDAMRVSRVLDDACAWSLRGLVAAHPRFGDYCDALRCAALQELAALSAGGQSLRTRLASVERLRGVVAFLMDRPGVALEQIFRASLQLKCSDVK